MKIEPGIDRSERRVAVWPATLSETTDRAETIAAPAAGFGSAEGVAPGTRIATARGLRRVELLEPGDRVITRDNGFVAVVAVARERVPASAVVTLDDAALRGVERGITMGRGQGLLWRGRRVSEALGSHEGLLRAGDLCPERIAEDGFVTLFLPVLDRQEVIYAEGVGLASALPAGGVPARSVLSPDAARRVLRA